MPNGRVTPVSYTHLDVYKRQDFYQEKYAKNTKDNRQNINDKWFTFLTAIEKSNN